MGWKKLGHVFVPDGSISWMHSHAANTVAEHLRDDIYRVYFNCRDEQQRSHIAWLDIDINPPFSIRALSPQPVLSPGELGTFDDSGVSLACILPLAGRKALYYVGWNLAVTVPWRNSIGLAYFDEESGLFERHSRAPIMDRSEIDPYSLSYPFVLNAGGSFRMWYGSNLSWSKKRGDIEHIIKYAESVDGIHWRREGIVALPFKNDAEYAQSRPCVLHGRDRYEMWYSWRGPAYRIGYAVSDDGITWNRKDTAVGIDVSGSGWDSESIEYPFVFEHKGERYMLYNGNAYGKTGFGLAVWEE